MDAQVQNPVPSPEPEPVLPFTGISDEREKEDFSLENSYPTSSKSKDNSSVNSIYNSSVQKKEPYVKNPEPYVQDNSVYVQNSSLIREENEGNTCKVPFSKLESFQKYAKVLSVQDDRIDFALDETQPVHFCVLAVNESCEEASADFKELDKLHLYRSNNKYLFFLASPQDTQKLLSRFVSKFKTVRLVWKIKATILDVLEEFKNNYTLSSDRLSNYKTPSEQILRTPLHRILWDEDMMRCLSKVVRYYTMTQKKPLTRNEAETAVLNLGFGALFASDRWKVKLEKIVNKYRHSFDPEKLSVNPVFSGAFSYILRSEMDPADLTGKNQKIRYDEVEFILYKITRKVYSEGQPCVLARNYFYAAQEQFKAQTGRKLNNHKLAQITTLLVHYEYITKKAGHNKASCYDLGKKNPYYRYEAPR